MYAKRDHKSAKMFSPFFVDFENIVRQLGSVFLSTDGASKYSVHALRLRSQFMWSCDDRWKGRASGLLLLQVASYNG